MMRQEEIKMFLFKKKKEKAAKEEAVPEISREELLKKAGAIQKELPDLSGEERNKALNELGSLYFEAEETDKAIRAYETSLSESKALGKAYTDLLKLYNIKRREASEAKDDAKMKEYMDKIDGLMKLSKDVIRGKA